jgi:signal peptidase I
VAATDDPALGADPAEPPPRPRRHKKSSGSFWRELPILIIVALGLAMVIKAFLIQAFFIPSGSMEKTLHGCYGCSGDRVLVNKLVLRFRDVHRGEIVVFNGVDSWTPEVTTTQPSNVVQRIARNIGSAIGIAPPGEEDFIKRVIGIPGDVVQCCDAKGRVTVNGAALTEPYVYQDDHAPFGPVTVPKGRLWVMGDHRGFSADSRAHIGDPGGGTIAESHVIGRAFVKVWPPSRIGTLPVPKTFSQPKLKAAAETGVPGALAVAGVIPIGWARHARRRRRLHVRPNAATYS